MFELEETKLEIPGKLRTLNLLTSQLSPRSRPKGFIMKMPNGYLGRLALTKDIIWQQKYRASPIKEADKNIRFCVEWQMHIIATTVSSNCSLMVEQLRTQIRIRTKSRTFIRIYSLTLSTSGQKWKKFILPGVPEESY